MEKKLLDVLACPKCKGKVATKGMFLLCSKCKLAYPVVESVPDMLPGDAWKMDKAKKAAFKHKLKL